MIIDKPCLDAGENSFLGTFLCVNLNAYRYSNCHYTGLVFRSFTMNSTSKLVLLYPSIFIDDLLKLPTFHKQYICVFYNYPIHLPVSPPHPLYGHYLARSIKPLENPYHSNIH